MQPLALAFLVAVSIGGLLWVFVYPSLSGEKRVEQRRESVSRVQPARTTRVAGGKSRRDQVEETLKEMEERHKKSKSPPLATRISQAGLTWSKQRFMIISVCLGVGAFLVSMIVGLQIVPALGIAFAAAFGLPRWILKFLKSRREKKFLNSFPDAVDVIVRGIKSGLPLMDSMRVIVADAPEPVKSEFRSILESQAVGIPLGEACLKLFERMLRRVVQSL